MKSITCTNSFAGILEAKLFDVGTLLKRLTTVSDGRHPKGLRYPLPTLLLLIILAKLSGEDSLSGVADWMANRKKELLRALGLSWGRMPHHNTLRRLLQHGIKPETLELAVREHLQQLPGVGHSLLIALDGKTLRGTISDKNPYGEHLLAAYLPGEGIVLVQMATESKENEISVAPRLLECLDLRGKVVMADAMHTQRALSIQILDGGGEYVWLVKDNQPTLREDIEYLFEGKRTTVEGAAVPNDFARAREVDKGHGRREVRQITVSSELKGYSDWPGLEQVFKLERQRIEVRGGKVERETVYGITSLTCSEASAERLLGMVRSYWGIENGLFGRRDVTFKEDRSRMTLGEAGRVMACINNLVISLLAHSGEKNMAKARRRWGTQITLSMATSDPCLVT